MAGVVFAALGAFGVDALTVGLWGFGVAWTVAGFATLAGALAIGVAALLARRAVVEETGTTGPTQATFVARCGRTLILLAAIATATTGVLLAPVGDDERPTVVGVNLFLAAAIALFALVADDVTRAIRDSRRAKPPAGANARNHPHRNP